MGKSIVWEQPVDFGNSFRIQTVSAKGVSKKKFPIFSIAKESKEEI